MAANGSNGSSRPRRKTKAPDLVLVKAVASFRAHAELHPPLRSGSTHTVDIKQGAIGIIRGPAPDGAGHIVDFEYGRHHTATAAVPADHFTPL